MFYVRPRLKIPMKELDFSFSRSSGPGGQNLNKTETKVTLRWNVHTASSISERLREKLLNKYASIMNSNGEIVIHSHRHRKQGQNITDCLEKLRKLILKAEIVVRPRIETKLPAKTKEERINYKKTRGEVKKLRKKVSI